MKKLTFQHAKSFLLLTCEGKETGNRICQILADVDADRTVSRINAPYTPAAAHLIDPDQIIIKHAMACVDYAEEAALSLVELSARRKMIATEEHLQLVSKAQQLGIRLCRNLWELTLDNSDRKIIRGVISKIAAVSVWEDVPAMLEGRSYERVANAMDGTVAYDHAYGITFMDYEKGQATNGWSVLRTAWEDLIEQARLEGEDRVLELITPQGR